jgi:predicted nucleotidyltransferase
MQPEPEVITKLVSQITEVIQPLRIILFGSAVRGEMGADSDLDVLWLFPKAFIAEKLHKHYTNKLMESVFHSIFWWRLPATWKNIEIILG